MTYKFLILSLLFLIPGTLIFAMRQDLRKVILTMVLFSIPFAFTETLFYPNYWEPVFVFDLVNKIGFGIEDLIFIIGLGAFTSTAYAFFMGATYEDIEITAPSSIAKRCATIMSITALLITTLALLDIEMIYGSVGIMISISFFIALQRKDLITPGLLGGLLSLFVYSLLSLSFAWLIPGVYNLDWHTDKFLNIFILGIPLEELMYGFSSGIAATVFYPYAFYKEFK